MSGTDHAPSTVLADFDLVDWPRRLSAERAMILNVLAASPSRRVLDLGSGAGHHARLLAEHGFEVVAIDASEAALDRARRDPVPDGVEFVLGEIGAVERSVRGHFGAAMCLGNTLPYLLSAESVSRMLVGLRRRLLPGAPVLLQSLNFDRDFSGDARALPLEFLPGRDGELAVLRTIEPREEGILIQTTSVLRYRPASVPPVQLMQSRAEQVRGWTREEMRVLLDVARLPERAVYGDMQGAPFVAESSRQLVIVAG